MGRNILAPFWRLAPLLLKYRKVQLQPLQKKATVKGIGGPAPIPAPRLQLADGQHESVSPSAEKKCKMLILKNWRARLDSNQ